MENCKIGNDDDETSTEERKAGTSFRGLFSFSSLSSSACNSNSDWPWKASYWSFVASLSFLCTGLLRAYTSPALLSIQNENKGNIPLSSSAFSMSRKELISWIASTPPLASFAGTILSGFCLDQLGRQRTLVLLTIPATFGWILVANAESIPILLFGRALTGLSSGLATASAPLYISDVCLSMSKSTSHDSSNRKQGWLGLLPGVMLSTGILFGFTLAHFVQSSPDVYADIPTWRRLALTISIFPIIVSLLTWTIPESHVWLQEKKRREDEKSRKKKELPFDLEMEQVVPPRNPRIPSKINLSEESELLPRDTSKKLLSHHLTLVTVLMILQQFSGGNGLIYYLSEILTKSGTLATGPAPTNEMVHQASLVVGVVQFLGFFLALPLIDHPKIGRRTLLIISSILMSLCHLLLGFHFHQRNYTNNDSNFNEDISLRVILLCALYSSYSIGLGPIPFQFIEIFPSTSSIANRATSYISSVASLVNHLALFAVVKSFPFMFHMDEHNGNSEELEHYHGPDVTFWIFSAVCFAAAIFSLVFVPGAKQHNSSNNSPVGNSSNDPG